MLKDYAIFEDTRLNGAIDGAILLQLLTIYFQHNNKNLLKYKTKTN